MAVFGAITDKSGTNAILNLYAPNTWASKFIKETPLKLSSHTSYYTVKVDDFKVPVSPIDRSSRWNLNRGMLELKEVINQVDLMDICRTCYLNTKEFNFFISHGAFTKNYRILEQKANLKSYQKLDIVLCIIPDVLSFWCCYLN